MSAQIPDQTSFTAGSFDNENIARLKRLISRGTYASLSVLETLHPAASNTGATAYVTGVGLAASDGVSWAGAGGGAGDVTLTGIETLTNKTLTAPVVNSPTGIVKADVGLGNVDNTSNVTERAAAATLTNKTISGASNTLSAIAESSVTNLVTDLAAKAPITTASGVATGRALTSADNNKTIDVTAASQTFTTPISLASGFGCLFLIPAGTTSFATSGGALINGATTTLTRTGPAIIALIATSTTDSYTLTDPLPSLSSSAPELMLNETDEGADEKLTRISSSGGAFSIVTLTDAGGAGKNILLATARTGTTPGYVQLGDPTVPLYLFGSLLEFVVNAAQIGGEIFIYGATPGMVQNATSGGTDQKRWLVSSQGTGATTFKVSSIADDASPGRNVINALRGTGVAVASLDIGNATDNTVVSFLGTATPRHGSTTLLQTTVALTNGAGAGAGTITNAPAAGNPTKWVAINDNGTTRYVPAW